MNEERREGSTTRDLLPDWVAGRLDGASARTVGEAVDSDEELAAEARLLEAVLGARPEPPEELAARIGAAVRADRAATSDVARPGTPPARRRAPRRLWGGVPRWSLAAAAVAVVALGTLELAERSVSDATGVGPLEEVALEDAPSPWGEDEMTIAGAPVLDGLSDEELTSLLEELGG